ncbi:MAG: hypothetical protein R3249_07980 [Nitriliruptorales bacterium]|nr:hypothetical protein [Nitriliruptorales bacterium]
MDSLNTMRALLTVMAAVAAIVLFTMEFWVPGAVMTLGVAIHTWHFWQITRTGREPTD